MACAGSWKTYRTPRFGSTSSCSRSISHSSSKSWPSSMTSAWTRPPTVGRARSSAPGNAVSNHSRPGCAGCDGRVPASVARRRQRSWKVPTTSRPLSICGRSSGVRAKARARGWLKQARTVSNPSAARRRAFSIASRLLPAPAQPRMDARGLPWRVRRTLRCIWVGARSSRSPSSMSLRSRARRTTSGSITSQMTSTWCSLRVRSPGSGRHPVARSRAPARRWWRRRWRSRPGPGTARPERPGPRSHPPRARLARSVCGKATAWIVRSEPRQRGSALILVAITRPDVSACSNGGDSSCRLPAYQRPNGVAGDRARPSSR